MYNRRQIFESVQRLAALDIAAPIGQPAARDRQLIGGGRILIGHHHGYSEFDFKLGRLVKEFKSLEGVTSVRRQPHGTPLLPVWKWYLQVAR